MIDLCKLGETDELLFDGKVIQQHLNITNIPKRTGAL